MDSSTGTGGMGSDDADHMRPHGTHLDSSEGTHPDGRADRERAEIWRLEHPELGELSVAVGTQDQLRRIDPGFLPEEGDMAQDGTGLVARRGEAVLGRASRVGGHRVGVCPHRDEPEPSGPRIRPLLLDMENPRIVVETDWRDRRVTQVRFRDEDQIADFQAPEGSWAARRLAAIEASPWKRVAYPLAAGLGKSGAAVLGIVLIPLLLRLLDPVIARISRLLPEIDLPRPQLDLPRLPELPLPSLPEIDLPGWAELMLDWSRVWVPLLLAVVVAAGAVHRARRAERTRRQWERDRAAETPDQAGSASVTPGIGVASGKCSRRASTPCWGRASSTSD